MASSRFFIVLSLSALILFSILSSSATLSTDDDEDLSFLEDDEDTKIHSHLDGDLDEVEEEEDDLENYDEFDGDHEEHKGPEVDEKDVVVLKDGNFSDFVEKNGYVMVEFYAPWCGHCQALAPEYAAAATELNGEVMLAKVDATEENDLSNKFYVEGFPTLYFFIDGVHKPYSGQRTKEGIVTWIKKKTGPGVSNVTKT